MWIKGSGGDLGSIKLSGLAALYSEKLQGLEHKYRGAEYEDEMVDMYPLCAFGKNSVAASIDTPLHGFLPFPHIDHLHPDWGIALAASANGREKMEEFNRLFDHHLIWVPWQRPGFELAMMLRRAVQESANCDGVVLGGHGLFTWGNTQQECYESTIGIIDQLGQFVVDHVDKKDAKLFGGPRQQALENRRDLALDIFPFLRGRVSGARRVIGSFSDLPEVLRFVNSAEAEQLAHLGTSCPDHFIRTKVRPLFVPWQPGARVEGLREQIDSALKNYRQEYAGYYNAFAQPDSPAMRDANPTVVLVPGIGMFSFGKSKTEARLTGEFYVNAIHVMEGATSLDTGKYPSTLPQAGAAAPTSAFTVIRTMLRCLPRKHSGLNIGLLEEAEICRQPPGKGIEPSGGPDCWWWQRHWSRSGIACSGTRSARRRR